jgi:uncharacterized membrane protein
MYELAKYVHILCAMAWVGGGFFAQVLVMRVERSGEPAEFPRLAAHLSFVVDRLFIPASILLFVAGLFMTVQRWGFQQTWIAVAIVLWVASVLAGSLYLGPLARRGMAAFDAEGPTSTTGRALLSRLFLITRIELGVFAVIVALMVVKPNIG